ncbi:MAG: LysM peptidoglycan-binding domain-containing protein [Gemmatimonadetes bacterium]|nr:LysM peptidoglycan-binding domain-containing protein [Gemmatimonadota bacterium]MYH51421.1 LysM peptidoglycan-binding domain-containing protein [Gemmatimonadota bacterium]MYK66654.1 LysM peptidoglycan-binding domain-containing protein [Gemmatimonadota bacterium]
MASSRQAGQHGCTSPSARARRFSPTSPQSRPGTGPRCGNTPSLQGKPCRTIARQYGVWLGALRSVNPEVEPRRIRIGTVLLIPCGKGRCRADPELQPTNSPQPGSQGSGLR